MKSELGLEVIARHATDSISNVLDRAGIMHRVFYRVKTDSSIQKKIESKNYRAENKKITDLIGIRITLYFYDDVDIVYSYLKSLPNFNHESTDNPKISEFLPLRCNLTFDFQEGDLPEVRTIIDSDVDVIDTTYEVQLRTVLSEGWHEVEHDLRYKCKEDWEGHDDLSRNMNGIYATLETSENSMLHLFNELSHRHYGKKNIEGLLKTQFRLRVGGQLSAGVKEYINSNSEVLKKFHRINRKKLIEEILNSKYNLPMTIENLVFVCNHLFVKSDELESFGDKFILEEIELSFQKSKI
jgi:putative GTP pyrophosphokinase